MEQHGEVHFNIRALNWAGFAVEVPERSRRLMGVWSALLMVPFLLIHVLAALEFVTSPRSLVHTVIFVYLMNNGLQTWLKQAYLGARNQRIATLLAFLKQCPTPEHDQLRLLDLGMRLQSAKHTRRFSVGVFAFNAFACLGIVVLPLMLRLAQVLYCDYYGTALMKCKNLKALYVYQFWWFNYDIYATPACYFLVMFECLMIVVFFVSFSSCDAFVCTLMLAAAERSAMLARCASQALKPGPRGDMTNSCRAWIRYHQHYLRLVAEVSDVISPLLFLTLTFATINIISYIYFFIQFEEPALRKMAITMLAGFLVQIWVYSVAGQKVRSKSGDLSRAVLNAANQLGQRGHLCAGPARSALQIVSARCSGKVLERFTGLGLFTVSLDLFARVLSASVSYTLVLLEMCHCAGTAINHDALRKQPHDQQ